MRQFKEIFEQHAEVGRFKPVQPHVVKPVGPRPEVDSSNVKIKEETELEKNSAAALTYKDKPNKEPLMKYKDKLKEDLRKWFDPKHPEGGWKRINSKGEAVGPCAREPGEAKPKCMSNAKRASLTKKERAAAVNAKRRHDPDPERKGKPINVSNFGKGKLSEQMNNLEEENKPTNPELWARAVSMAKSKFDVYPSAYANGWAAKWYKSKGGGWRSVNEETDKNQLDELNTRTLVNYLPKAGRSLDSLSPEKRARRHKNMISTWKKVFKRPDSKEEVAKYRAEKGLSKSVNEENLLEMPGANMDTRALHKHLKKKGWELSRTSGSHDVFTHPKAKDHIAVPRHRQLKAPLVKGILDQTNVVNENVVTQIKKIMKNKNNVSEQSDVFKSIRFAKNTRVGKDRIDIKHASPSTDDEEHYTVGTVEFEQQLKHIKKRAMQESKQIDEIVQLAIPIARVAGSMAAKSAVRYAAKKGASTAVQNLAGTAANLAGRYGTYRVLKTDKDKREYNEQVEARKVQIVKDAIKRKKSDKFEPNPELTDRNSPEV